jgi:hypothetical protein
MNTIELSAISRTVTIVVPAAKDTVFSFLAKVENLPAWATEFCEGLKREGEHFKVVTSFGELFFRIEADPRTGVIDMFSGPTPTDMDIFPCRVIGLGGGRSAITFTFFRPADMPEEMYERQYQSLVVEMDGLVKRFSKRD